MTETLCFFAACAHSKMAETCGMPAPETTRVVQMEPAPTPTLIASAPALTSISTPDAVAMIGVGIALFFTFANPFVGQLQSALGG